MVNAKQLQSWPGGFVLLLRLLLACRSNFFSPERFAASNVQQLPLPSKPTLPARTAAETATPALDWSDTQDVAAQGADFAAG